MNEATDRHDRLLTQLLLAYFGELEPGALDLLRTHLRWVELAGGQTLMQQGEAGDSMYLTVSGRLRAYVQQDDGRQRMVREMGRGQVVGEMSLYTDEPRSATVVAIRDSVLVRLDKEAFDRLIAASSQVAVALTRQIIQRLKTEHQTAAYAAPITVGLMPVTAGVAAFLAKQPETKIQIAGHTDSQGADAANMDLSSRRAAAVGAYLTSTGVNAARITSVGMGESAPTAVNDTAAGRAINRRVEVTILN